MDPATPASGVAALAVEHLRDSIRAGRFAPGDRIVERTVAEELDISSIAVRDAFAQLVHEGWIERLPRRGVRVRMLDPDAVEDISQARELLEGRAAVLAVKRLADEDTDTTVAADLLAGIPRAMDRAAARGDRGALLALDDAFHATLWHLGGSPVLEELLQNLRARITPLLRRSLDDMPADELRLLGGWHDELVEALHTNERAARRAVAAHVNRTRERVLPTTAGRTS